MEIRQDPADYPAISDGAVERLVRRVRAAAASGDRPLVLVGRRGEEEPGRTVVGPRVDSAWLRLGFVSRTEQLLRDRPELGRILPEIHRFFDEQADAPSEESLGSAVLASVLAVRIREEGLSVELDPADLFGGLCPREGIEADVLIRAVRVR
jgi:hypothetical protein